MWYFGMHFTEKASLRTSYFLISNVKCGNVSWIHWNSMSLRRLFFYMFIISNILYLEEYFFAIHCMISFSISKFLYILKLSCYSTKICAYSHEYQSLRYLSSWYSFVKPSSNVILNDLCSIASEENSTIFFCH